MLRRSLNMLPVLVVFTLVGLVSFAGVAFAADQALPQDASAQDLLKQLYAAFSHGEYLYTGCIAVVLAVAIVKHYGDSWKWAHSDAGAAVLVLAGSFAATLGAHLASHEVPTLAMAWSAFKIACGAAGGYTLIKHLVIDPLIKKYKSKLPKWLQTLLPIITWVFDRQLKQSDNEKSIAEAEKDGDDAVAAKPSQGVEDILGKPTEIQ